MRVMRILAVLSAVVLVAGGCSDEKSDNAASTTTAASAPTGPQTYTVVVDGPSTLGAENYVFGTYFPNNLNVRPGDTITYDNRSSNDIHTVTFGVKSDRSDQPPTVLKSRQANPVVFGPCYTTAPAKPDITCPPPTAGAPEYSGKGFWNSGVIMPPVLPPEAGPKTTTVKLGADIAPGTYLVTCLLHPNMEHGVTVVGSDAERQSQAEVAAKADQELGATKAQGTSIVIPTAGTTPDGATVASGWSNKLVAVNRFYPETVAIKEGQTVTWRVASDLDAPHRQLPAALQRPGRTRRARSPAA